MVTEENALQRLKLLRQEFDAWRKTKAYRNEKMPDELWSKACELVPFIPLTRIVTSLKISLNTLKKLAQEKGYEPKYSGHPVDKTRISAPALETCKSQSPPEVSKFLIPTEEPLPGQMRPHSRASQSYSVHLSFTSPGGVSATLDIPSGTDNQMVQTIITSLGGLSHGT